QQPAQHADGGGLPAAVRAEEAVDLALRHLEGEMVDHCAAFEGLGQPLGVDGDLLGVGHRCASCAPGPRLTLTGWPAVSFAASPEGLASTRNTSFCRCFCEKINGGAKP